MKKMSLFIFVFSLGAKSNEIMTVYDYFKDFKDDMRHEGPINELLKKDPIKKKVNYLIVPWQKLRRPDINSKLDNLKLNGGFTVCAMEAGLNSFIPFFKKIGIDVVFAQNATTKKFKGIKVITVPYYALNGIQPSLTKDIFYSFIGSATTHRIRSKIISMTHSKNSIVIARNGFHFFKPQKLQEAEKIEYKDILSRSRFSLCPRGKGVCSYRFWESLQAGAIPVLISDDYLLPPGVDWSKCIVRVQEKDVLKTAEILKKITKKQESIMRENCLAAYLLFSGENLAKVIRDYYRTN